MKKLQKLKIIKISNGANAIFVDDKFINGVLEANISLKGGEIPQAILTIDAKDLDIGIDAEIKKVQATKEKIVVVKYETSEGLKEITFENADNIISFADEDKGLFFIEERQEGKKYNKELAAISLDNFVSYKVEEKENKL